VLDRGTDLFQRYWWVKSVYICQRYFGHQFVRRHTFEDRQSTVHYISLTSVTTIRRTSEFVQHKQHKSHNKLIFMVLGITSIVYSDVCLRYRVRESYCSTVGSGIGVSVWVSVNGCTAKLALSVDSVTVGTAWLMSGIAAEVFNVLWNVDVLLIIDCTAVTQINRTKQHGKSLSCKANRTFSMLQYSRHVSEYFHTHYITIQKNV
jgi:hypothetical protein